MEGRVEICSNQRWETISTNYWGSDEARVTCNALGYGFGKKYDSPIVTSMQSYAMWQSISVHLFLQRRRLTEISMTTTTSSSTSGSAPTIIMITTAVFGLEGVEDQRIQTTFSVGEQSWTFHSVIASPTQHCRHTTMM